MDAATIRIRHYAPEGSDCGPVRDTYDTLSTLVEQLGPKLEKMGFPVTLEKVPSGGEPAKNNMVTMECQEIEFPETPLDEILGLEASARSCNCSAVPSNWAMTNTRPYRQDWWPMAFSG